MADCKALTATPSPVAFRARSPPERPIGETDWTMLPKSIGWVIVVHGAVLLLARWLLQPALLYGPRGRRVCFWERGTPFFLQNSMVGGFYGSESDNVGNHYHGCDCSGWRIAVVA